jgi:hypothetical protein
MFLDYINAWAFWLALGIGMLFAYMLSPLPKVVYKYPTPENAGKVMYVDTHGVCYRYKAVPIDCPADRTQVKPVVRG